MPTEQEAKTQTNIDQCLDKIRMLIAEDESKHNSLPINEKLFGRKLAVGGYKRILEDNKRSASEKLEAIYRIAVNLSLNPKFNEGTDVHHKIRKIALSMVEPSPANRKTI